MKKNSEKVRPFNAKVRPSPDSEGNAKVRPSPDSEGPTFASPASYLPTIGLEIHAELKTASKMFCSCKNDPDEDKPNTNVCPICMGHPGTLPVLNKEAIAKVLKIGIAVEGKLADFTEWDRKQYFYPDIPKGYQISQYAHPLISGGKLSGIELERIHLEEDTAQSTHDLHEKSLINFNRAGVPLMELVTKPVIHDAKTAVAFAKELQFLIRAIGAGEANMEKGEMRVEANVSVAPSLLVGTVLPTSPTTSPRDESHRAAKSRVEVSASSQDSSRLSSALVTPDSNLGTKTEVKNLNSFRAVEKAIDYEIKRQIGILERGEKVVQETRGWDEHKEETISRRSKESAHDYRYFPEPDIPKMKISEIQEFSREILSNGMPELPWKRRERFLNDFGATAKEAEMFVENSVLADYFEEIVGAMGKYLENGSVTKSPTPMSDIGVPPLKRGIRTAMNYLLTDYLGELKKKGPTFSTGGVDKRSDLSTMIPPASWAELVAMIINGELSSRGAKDVIGYLIQNPTESPRNVAMKHSLIQQNDPTMLREAIRGVIEGNSAVVTEYRAGKTASLQYLIGQVMKVTKGSANPALIKSILIELIG